MASISNISASTNPFLASSIGAAGKVNSKKEAGADDLLNALSTQAPAPAPAIAPSVSSGSPGAVVNALA